MGNWRRVQIIGSCALGDVSALIKALDPGKDYENFHCLVNGGIAGLPQWASENIDAIGNLAERGYSVDDVAEQLEALAKVAPSLAVKVHCGGDYEVPDCVATVILDKGNAAVGDAEIEMIPETPKGQIESNFLQQLLR